MKHTSNDDFTNTIPNRFELVLVAARRTKELMHGYRSKLKVPNKSHAATALDEIAAGYIGREYMAKVRNRDFSGDTDQ